MKVGVGGRKGWVGGRMERVYISTYLHQCLSRPIFEDIHFVQQIYIKLNSLIIYNCWSAMYTCGRRGRDSSEYHNKNIVTISCVIWYYLYIKYTIKLFNE